MPEILFFAIVNGKRIAIPFRKNAWKTFLKNAQKALKTSTSSPKKPKKGKARPIKG
jgi:hypothetical protein